jgi:hypothetical protein
VGAILDDKIVNKKITWNITDVTITEPTIKAAGSIKVSFTLTQDEVTGDPVVATINVAKEDQAIAAALSAAQTALASTTNPVLTQDDFGAASSYTAKTSATTKIKQAVEAVIDTTKYEVEITQAVAHSQAATLDAQGTATVRISINNKAHMSDKTATGHATVCAAEKSTAYHAASSGDETVYIAKLSDTNGTTTNQKILAAVQTYLETVDTTNDPTSASDAIETAIIQAVKDDTDVQGLLSTATLGTLKFGTTASTKFTLTACSHNLTSDEYDSAWDVSGTLTYTSDGKTYEIAIPSTTGYEFKYKSES